MTLDQGALFAIFAAVFALLIWGRVRYDLVAFAALTVATIAGLVPGDEAFSGFGHPAVVIIALVLIVSRALVEIGRHRAGLRRAAVAASDHPRPVISR
jgi:di/tricarboxylate transporter